MISCSRICWRSFLLFQPPLKARSFLRHWGRSDTSKWGMCCLQNPNGPTKCCVCLVVRRAVSPLPAPHHWIPKNFTEVDSPWILVGFISHPLMDIYITKSKVVVISCSPGPNNIISIWCTNVVILWNRQTIKIPLKFFFDTDLAFIYPSGKTVKVYYTGSLANWKQIASGGPDG